MSQHKPALLLALALAGLLAGCKPAEQAVKPAAVDAARLTAAEQDTANWMSYGRTYSEQRFSPLKQVNDANIGQLGLAWSVDLDAAHRAQEATPLIIDGVMYVTTAWSKLFAFDAAIGKQLWAYDPKVPGQAGVHACCDAVNRGAAAWEGKLYVGTLDGRLVAVDAATGKEVWSVRTTPEGSRYTITGAPRVAKGKVLIGNGGAELGVRGYVTAYDAATGKQLWRFYTVPANPADGPESPALQAAAKTWTGEWWKLGGGGTVWDSIVYDPELDLVYIGVGNGAPWARKIRSPGGGDNLYLSSIVALKAETGEYVWHYQTTPGDTWDYTATQHIMLADLPIDGKPRKVLMQAPKNGYFYVLDRATGELLSATPYAAQSWTTGFDMKTGRPIEHPDARWSETGKPFLNMPGPGGAHSWQPMSFNPTTGLVYIPAMDVGFPYIPDANFKERKLGWNTGVDFNAGSLPQVPAIKAAVKGAMKGYLKAWDPVAKKEMWRVEYPYPWNGGTLATAGNLVFQGDGMGNFSAFRADTGAKVWSASTGTGILAPPVSYEVKGEQYIAIETGWGGAFGLAAGELARDAHSATNVPRLMAFKIGGKAEMPKTVLPPPRDFNPPADTKDEKAVVVGKAIFHTYCSVCHGDSAVSTGTLPDLRYSAYINAPGGLKPVVLGGALQAKGMPNFTGEVTEADLELVRTYIVRRAHESIAEAAAAKAK